jgi:hypothetical protein
MLQIEKTGTTNKACIISKVTNPCILSIMMLLFILLTKSDSLAVLVKNGLTIIFFLVILPLAYVFIRKAFKKEGTRFLSDPTIFLKQHPRDIIIIGLICGLPCWGVVILLQAPSTLILTLTVLLVVAVILALINLFYRASFHLATVSVLVVMSGITWGPAFYATAAILPLIGWAKYQLREHNPAQMIIAIFISLVIVLSALYLAR